jgi:hypothetical protein
MPNPDRGKFVKPLKRLLLLRATEISLLVCLFVGAWQSPALAQANVQGQWTTLYTQMPINPIHLAMMNNGKVLVVAGSGNNANNTTTFMAGVWDPTTKTITTQPVDFDMFCNAMVVLPDGRPFVMSGTILYKPGFTGDPRTAAYDPATGKFVDLQPMAHGRWYPTGTTLSDGSVMVFSGLDENGNTNTAVEIYKVGVGWSQQYMAGWTPPLYPRLHLLPNGKVFYSGWTSNSAIFDPSTHQWQQNYAATNYTGVRTYGTSVLLPLTPANNYKPEVMIMGGGNPSTNTTELIDLSAASPKWVNGPPMSQPRIEMDAVILPTGKILAVNGSTNDEDATTASLNADLYDPSTNTFSSAGANAFARLYHSGALLLPDATVLVVGGNPAQGTYNSYVELYTPAYLFASDGSLASRPTITSVTPGPIGYNSPFQVQTPQAANISSAVLVRAAAVTHAFDMDQRLVGLNFTVNGGTLNLTSPPNSSIAPPGYYMLFLLNSAGVPSVARFVQLSLTATDQPPTGSITSPSSNVTITAGQSVNFSGTGTDPDGTVTGYSWVFPGGTPSSSQAQNPGNVAFSTPGTYVTSLTVTDNSGSTDPSPKTVTITVLPAFSLSVSPTTQTVATGGNTSFSVTVTPGSGFTGTVNFSVSGLPSGASATFNPPTVTGSGSTTMNVTTGSAAAGFYPLTVSGTSGNLSGSANAALAHGVVATPVITPITDTYIHPVSVSISDGTNGSTIYFTADGSTPTVTPAEKYTGPVTLSASTTVRAIAVANGLTNSAQASAVYNIQTGVSGCPCTIWPPTATPGLLDSSETQPVELGVKFASLFNGYISGIRFYKGVKNTGTHVGNLWTSSGALLATATFSGETASGWQQVNFSSPVQVTANTVYVASYFSPTGDFSVDRGYFATGGVNNPPLSALTDGGMGGANAVYAYGSTSQFPVNSFQSSNYWVDAVFTTTAAGTPVAIATKSLPGGNVGTAYSQTLTAAGGTSPYTWSLTSGSTLPAGLALSSNGIISGTPTAPGTTSFTVKVTDSSSPAQTAQATLSITIASSAPPPGCPCTIWPSTATPGGSLDSNQTQPVELGVKFTSSAPGYVTGVRFFKGVNNTGTHLGHLWSNTGTVLATATFTGETGFGWQQVNFSSPVAIAANTVYVASYFSPTGDFSVDRSYFVTAGVNNPPLQALVDGGLGGANAVYAYGSTSQFPVNSFQSSNYWVDVVFNTTAQGAPLAVTTTSLPGGTQGTAYSQTLTAGGGTSPYAWSLASGSTLPAGLTLSSSGVISGPPSATGTTSFTVQVTDSSSPVQTAQATLSITIASSAPPPGCPCTIWPSTAAPAGVVDINQTQPVELGVKFTSSAPGYVTGVRFFKGVNNTGTHLGHLWSNTGTVLATATFTGETGFGWQQVNFSSPIAIAANTVYVASYFSPTGDFSVDRSYFGTGVNNPPLQALVDGGLGGANAVYAYGSTSQFPVNSFQSSNYWVDVVFNTTAQGAPLAVTTTSLPGGTQGTAYSQTLTAGGGTSPYTWSLASGSTLPAGLALSSNGIISGTPSATGTTSFTVKVTDSSSPVQTAQATLSITITSSVPPPGCPCTIWPSTAAPAGIVDINQTQPVELGVKFTATSSGHITGIRFYKGINNTGVHVANLWTSTGTLLATATFTGETGFGWQQVNFSSPVAIMANTVYVASYFSPTGDFSVDRNYFATSGVSNPPLQALANGGSAGTNAVYAYGSTSQFPVNSYQSSNYWVDVVFNQ